MLKTIKPNSQTSIFKRHAKIQSRTIKHVISPKLQQVMQQRLHISQGMRHYIHAKYRNNITHIMRTSCSLGSLLPINDVISCASRLSNTNVDTIWIPETWGMENFAMLSSVATAAPSSHIGSSIINVYSRSPASIAMGAATIDTISNGRLTLGLGASSRAITEGLHGIPYHMPLRRVQETVEIIRLALSGKKINYSGQVFTLRGFHLLTVPVRDKIPIYLAAINSKMVRLAWDIADGVIFYLRPISEMRNTINTVQKESNKTIDVSCQIITCVSDDETCAMERARKTIAFYVAVGSVYRDFLATHGFAESTLAIYEKFKSEGFDQIHSLVPDEMVQELAITGTPRKCKKQLELFRDVGIDLPILQFNPVGKDIKDSFEVFADTFFCKETV